MAKNPKPSEAVAVVEDEAALAAQAAENAMNPILTSEEKKVLAYTGLPTNRKGLENWEKMNNNQRSQTIQRHCQPQLIDMLTKTTVKESTIESQLAGRTLLASITAATKDSRKLLVKAGTLADANLWKIASLVADQMDDVATMILKAADMLRQSAAHNPSSLTYPKAYGRILPSTDGEGLLRMILGLTEQSKAEKLSTLKRLEASDIPDDDDME